MGGVGIRPLRVRVDAPRRTEAAAPTVVAGRNWQFYIAVAQGVELLDVGVERGGIKGHGLCVVGDGQPAPRAPF